MAPEWIYLLKVNVGIALFYAFYKLFCQRDTFFQWRRFALLSFLGISLVYPLLNIQAWVKEQPAMYELADYYDDGRNGSSSHLLSYSPITRLADHCHRYLLHRSRHIKSPFFYPTAQHFPDAMDRENNVP